MDKSFVYEFQDELPYFKAGGDATAETLTVYAPTNKVLNEITVINLEYEKAKLSLQQKSSEVFARIGQDNLNEIIKSRPAEKEVAENKSETITPEIILDILYSGGADVMKCFNNLRHILTLKLSGKPFAVLDEAEGKGEKMTDPIFEAMTPRDTNAILGKYIATFITASPNN